MDKFTNLVGHWHVLDMEIAQLTLATDDLADTSLDVLMKESADVEGRILTYEGEFESAAIKLEISLRYAEVGGIANDPAWEFVRAALADIKRVCSVCCPVNGAGGVMGEILG